MQKAKSVPVSVAVGTLRTLPSVLISLCLATAAVDAMLIKEPSLLRPLRDGWQIWLGSAWIPASSASLIASSVAVACIAISAVVLFSFIQAVQALPHGRNWAVLAFAAAAAAGGYAAAHVEQQLEKERAQAQHPSEGSAAVPSVQR